MTKIGDKSQSQKHSTKSREANNIMTEEEIELQYQQSLELFDFMRPLPEKSPGILRLFYNNCNSLEITNTIGVYLKSQKDKIKHKYIKNVETPTKLDSLIQQMCRWEVDIVSLAEMCIAWEKQVPRRVIQ